MGRFVSIVTLGLLKTAGDVETVASEGEKLEVYWTDGFFDLGRVVGERESSSGLGHRVGGRGQRQREVVGYGCGYGSRECQVGVVRYASSRGGADSEGNRGVHPERLSVAHLR